MFCVVFRVQRNTEKKNLMKKGKRSEKVVKILFVGLFIEWCHVSFGDFYLPNRIVRKL